MLLSLALGYRINTLHEKEREATKIQTELAESFKRFVPIEFLKELGKKSILDVRLGDAQIRKMAIFFMDIRDFTRIAENQSAERTLQMLNRFFAVVESAIRTRGGFIDKFLGDAVMALFLDSKSAVESALEILTIQRDINLNQENLNIGIGIHSAEVVLGTIGSPSRLDTTVIGDAVNLASRIENLTRQYSVHLIVTESLVQDLGDEFWFRELDTVLVKGKSARVKIIEVIDKK